MIETSSTTLGKTVDEREILDLPLNGRNFSQLGLLQPGVVPITPGLAQAGGSLRAGQAYSVNGQRPESNNFLIDGASNVNAVDGGFVLEPPIDAIAQFKILTNTSNAECGSAAGSTTNIITRSGSNSLRGAAWEFLHNDKLDAANYFENAAGFKKSEYRQNQFGDTLGGPIRKDKAFSPVITRDSETGRAKPSTTCVCPLRLKGRATFQKADRSSTFLRRETLRLCRVARCLSSTPTLRMCWTFTLCRTPRIRTAC